MKSPARFNRPSACLCDSCASSPFLVNSRCLSTPSWLSRGGPATTTTLANQEQITTQSIGATISSLEKRGLVERRPDTDDGRQSILSVTSAGSRELRHRRDTRTVQLSKALSSGFTASEMTELQSAAILLERLAYLL